MARFSDHPDDVSRADTVGRSDDDVATPVSMLEHQHDTIRELLDLTVQSSGASREDALAKLTVAMSVHEALEELIVHPGVLREHAAEGTPIVERRREEERDILANLAAIGDLPIDSETFAVELLALRTAALSHNELEEAHEFELLPALDSEAFNLLDRVTRRLGDESSLHAIEGLT